MLDNGTFVPVNKSTVHDGTRIFGSRFTDELKEAELGVLFKSHLVPQNYCDDGASNVAAKAPTIQRFTQRLMFAISASAPNTQPFIL